MRSVRSRVGAVAAILLPAIGAALLTLADQLQDIDGGRRWTLVGCGLALILTAAAIQTIREVRRSRERAFEQTEAVRLRVAMKDALQPVTERIAGMPALKAKAREAQLQPVAVGAVGALALLLKDVDRLRAVVYQIEPDGSAMTHLAYAGRGGHDPQPFTDDTSGGEDALALVRSGGHEFVPDLRRSPAHRPAAAQRGYQTYISASIAAGENAYGMLTVDAPHAGDLVDTDEEIVLVIADLLAIAFAIADSR